MLFKYRKKADSKRVGLFYYSTCYKNIAMLNLSQLTESMSGRIYVDKKLKIDTESSNKKLIFV